MKKVLELLVCLLHPVAVILIWIDLATRREIGGVAKLAWALFSLIPIVPFLYGSVVERFHWLTQREFVDAVAVAMITPGPVVQTVAVVGYAAAGLGGGLLAAFVAFAPSFCFVIAGAPHFDRLRADTRIQAFLTGAGAAVIGAIAGSAIPLGRELVHIWQLGILGLAAVWLLGLRRGVVTALLAAGVLGVIAVLAGAPA